jgi:hypothetical protein
MPLVIRVPKLSVGRVSNSHLLDPSIRDDHVVAIEL